MRRDTNTLPFGGRHQSGGAGVTGRSFLLVLFGAFVAIMLVALLVGLQGYRTIADERNAVDDRRLAYGSLVNTVKAFDSANALSVNEYEGNDVLSMTQTTPGGTYLMLLYVHDGMLMQQYSVANDATIAPENAHPLFATDTFRVSYGNDLLTLTTDTASPVIYLRTPQSFLTFKFEQRASVEPEAGDAS